MTEFTPPVSERKTDELIEIVSSGKDHWNEEAIRQSKQELVKRNISQKEQERVIEKWEKEAETYLAQEKKRLKKTKLRVIKFEK